MGFCYELCTFFLLFFRRRRRRFGFAGMVLALCKKKKTGGGAAGVGGVLCVCLWRGVCERGVGNVVKNVVKKNEKMVGSLRFCCRIKGIF